MFKRGLQKFGVEDYLQEIAEVMYCPPKIATELPRLHSRMASRSTFTIERQGSLNVRREIEVGGAGGWI